MKAKAWLDAYAAELGVEPPTDDEIEQVLAIAGEAAHSSERIAAPVACWIGGRAGASLERMRAAADAIGDATP